MSKVGKVFLIVTGALFVLSGISRFSEDPGATVVGIGIGAGLIYWAIKGKYSTSLRLGAPHSPEEAPPAPPTQSPAQVWGHLPQPIDLANTFKFRPTYRAILEGHPGFEDENGTELKVKVLVWRDADNPVDANAVGVWLDQNFLGHIPAYLAADYAPALDEVGRPVETTARIWGRDDAGTVRSRTSIYLPAPDALVVLGDAPTEDEIVLPEGPKIQVLGEEFHMNILEKYVPAGTSRSIWLRLAKSIDFRPRSARDRIDVFLDGERVGWLSDAQTKNLLPLVDFALERGKTPVARGNITGSKLQAKLTLQTAKADAVTDDWLDAQGPATHPANKRPEFDWDD